MNQNNKRFRGTRNQEHGTRKDSAEAQRRPRPTAGLPFRGLIAGLVACLVVGAAAVAAEPANKQWWQRGQTSWHYKDDWKGPFLEGGKTLSKTVEVPSDARVKAAFVYVWCNGNYDLRINGQHAGEKWGDSGTVENFDITKLIKPGANTIELERQSESNIEGAVVLADGKEIHFFSDESWGQGLRASQTRRRGPRGYAGDCHMAKPVTVTVEQKAKAAVNHVNGVRRRILTRDQLFFWRSRDPREALTLGETTEREKAWRRVAELLDQARSGAEKATSLIYEGKHAEALEAVKPATKATDDAAKAMDALLASVRDANDARGKAVNSATLKADEGAYTHNGSKYNRLGWVASCEPLDSDPTYWEFDITPGEVPSINLAGLWKFRTDFNNRWKQFGYYSHRFKDDSWPAFFAPTKWGWERQGITDWGRGGNKPYNGHAWYRKTMTIPAAWREQDLVLKLGPRWGNQDWLAVNEQFVQSPDGRGSNADDIAIPANLVQAGAENTLALRVLNNDNIGGIINPGLRLSVKGAEPVVKRHICGAGAMRQIIYTTDAGKVEQRIYSSALSPGVIVATSGKTVRLGGWKARGYLEPTHASAMGANGIIERALVRGQGGTADSPAGNYLLLTCKTDAANASRPLLVVFEKRPTAVDVIDDGFGGSAVELTFDDAGARVGLVRLDRGAEDKAELWAKAMLKYPVEYVEQLSFDGDACKVRMGYGYLQMKDDWNTSALSLAPVPMLMSYAVEHKWPQAKVAGEAKDFGLEAKSGYYPGSECGKYRAIEGADSIAYSFDRMEPKVHYKGYGTLGEENGLGEPMYANMAKWGANSYRPQLRGPDVPRLTDFGNAERMERFDRRIRFSRKYNLVCFLNFFTGQGLNEEQRKHFFALWTSIAKHCKDLPEDAVVYNLINEPAHFHWDDYNKFVKEVTAAVREIDKKHWMSIEFGGGWAQPEDADMCVPTGDEKTIYQFHFYGPHSFDVYRESLWYPRYETGEERFRSYEGWEERMLSPVRFLIRHQKEVLHGEFGVSFLGPEESPRKWLEDVLAIHEKYRMHWNWWNYSGNGISRTGLAAGKTINPLVETLTEFAKMKPPK